MAAAAAPRVGLLYDERMCAHATPDGAEHPENPERLRAIWRKLAAEDVASRCVVMMAREAKDRYIASVHSRNHINLMKNISSKEYDSRRNKVARKFNSIYFNKGSSESAFLAAGSVIEVAEKVAAGELNSAIALVRPPGHHAEHNEAMGFCLFNNVAIAANYLLNERPDLGIKKILIVDWDVHHGNGTQKMFYSDPRVLFFSVHRWSRCTGAVNIINRFSDENLFILAFDYGSFYPAEGDASHCFIGEGAGKGYNINVPWEHGKCGDADYIAAWDHVLLPVAEAFDPDIILVSAGFDAIFWEALGDPLGGCCITPNGYSLLLSKLLGFAQGRIVMALEGGYNLRSIANSVFSCAKVLLGDKFTCNSPEMQPFESTWRVIQAVRNELKTCWPILSSKLPEKVSLRSKPSQIELYSSSGSEPDVEDVNELPDAISSVNVIQVADDVVSEYLSKLNLDEDNFATKTTSSCVIEQSPTDSVEAQSDGSVVVSKRIYDLSFSWRSVLSRVYVWYASFGSNMWKPRFLCYVQGGKVDGMNVSCFGSHDTSPPKGAMWKHVPHRLFFGRSSTPCWGTGGVAFLNPEMNYNEKSYVFMYKITLEQFNDVLFQENRLGKENSEDGKFEYPDYALIGSSEIEFVSANKALHLEPIKDSWYSNVLHLGEEDGLPILTMTCPSSDVKRYKSGELPLSPPSETYSATLIKGLVEGKQLDAGDAAGYINAAAARGL